MKHVLSSKAEVLRRNLIVHRGVGRHRGMRASFIVLMLFGLVVNLGFSCVVYRSSYSNWNEYRWNPLPSQIRFWMNSSAPNPACSTRIKNAYQAWDDEGRSNTVRFYAGETTRNVTTLDTFNLIRFPNSNPNYPNWLAGTWSWVKTTPNYTILDADIEVYTKWNWYYGDNPGSNQWDFQSTLTHEFGHTLDLTDLYWVSDSSPTYKTMFGYGRIGSLDGRSIEQDDKDGIAYLYPTDSRDMVWLKSAAIHDGSPLPLGSNCWESPDVRYSPDPPIIGQPCTLRVTPRNMRPVNLNARLIIEMEDPDVYPVPWRGVRHAETLFSVLVPAGNTDVLDSGREDYANAKGDGETTYTFVWTPALNRFNQAYHTYLATVVAGTDSLPFMYVGFWGTNDEAHRSFFSTNRARAGIAETLMVGGGNNAADTVWRHLTVDSTNLPAGWHASVSPWSDTSRKLLPNDTFMPFKVVIAPSSAAQPGDSGIVRISCIEYMYQYPFWWRKDCGVTWKVKIGQPADVAVMRIISPTGSFDSSVAVTPSAKVRNYGTTPATFKVFFRISDGWSDSVQVQNLVGGDSATATFDTWPKPHIPGGYTTRCSTYNAGDPNHTNDVATGSFTVTANSVVDVGVMRIVTPTGSFDSSVAVTPVAKVRNYGSGPATFKTFFRIIGGWSDSTQVASLAAGDSATATFTAWPKPHTPGDYTTRCSTYLAGDNNHTNDALGGSFTVTGGGVPPWETSWVRKADVPTGPKGKNVKDGGCLAYLSGASSAYALKGNNRCEFYRYDITANSWTAAESIPAVGSSGKKKAVKKGASLTAADGALYAAKGDNTVEFWRYLGSAWSQMADLPVGAKNIKEGSGAAPITLGETTWVYFLKGSGTNEFYRYNTASNAWQRMADAPSGVSGKAFKDGSCVAVGSGNLIYALKGSYDEFYTYDPVANVWTTRTALPFIGASGKKVKAKSGANLASIGGRLYALKGNNTLDLWRYDEGTAAWTQAADMPMGGGKKIKGGGSLAAGDSRLYALKGNNTLEFYSYAPAAACGPRLATDGSENSQSGFLLHPSSFVLSVSPNPYTSSATIGYSLPKAGNVTLQLYDVAGALVTTFVNAYSRAGEHSFPIGHWSPGVDHSSSGLYLVRLHAPGCDEETKITILK